MHIWWRELIISGNCHKNFMPLCLLSGFPSTPPPAPGKTFPAVYFQTDWPPSTDLPHRNYTTVCILNYISITLRLLLLASCHLVALFVTKLCGDELITAKWVPSLFYKDILVHLLSMTCFFSWTLSSTSGWEPAQSLHASVVSFDKCTVGKVPFDLSLGLARHNLCDLWLHSV